MKKLTFALGLALLFMPSISHAEWRDARPQHGPRGAPPSPREERRMERRGFVWNGGYYGWRRDRYVWYPGHLARERRGREWREGRWERHEDHYDWYRGGWYPHR